MIIKRIYLLGISFLLAINAALLHSYNPDNRYFPFVPNVYVTVPGRPSHFSSYLLFTTAHDAFGLQQDTIGIGEIYGTFDLSYMGESLTAVGGVNPLPPEFASRTLPYNISGKIQSEGFSFYYQQAVYRWFSVGYNLFVMQTNSTQFFTPTFDLSNADFAELERDRRIILRDLGLSCGYARQLSLGDMDLYGRISHAWDYIYKFRRIEADFRIGVLVPTGAERHINNPASIPFGGNGHWGIYTRADAEFEVKEDWKVGLIAMVSKRLPKNEITRMPAFFSSSDGDIGITGPVIFGAVVGPACINPGATLIGSAYVLVENARGGLGGRIQYTATSHRKDCWTDLREQYAETPAEKAYAEIPVGLDLVERRSEWESDYLSLIPFYDFGKMKTRRDFDPIVKLRWDIPTLFLLGKGVVKTQAISLGVEFNF